MTTLNISLCLPQLDFTALTQKRSVVAVVKRFIVPDRSFALLPCRSDLVESSSYHPSVVSDLEPLLASRATQMEVTHWAQCVFCQKIDERALAILAKLSIWTENSLVQRLEEGSLFLAFLRTYELSTPFPVDAEPVCEQIYKFIPLPSYLSVSTELPVYNDEDFATAQREILEPESVETEPSDDAEEGQKTESILNSPNWIEKISEVGNSSNGQDFEKLVRKGLVLLGFSNSQNRSIASIDPEATGGAGGLDFYADRPYAIVGECKASASDRVGTPAKQLHKLATQWLGKKDCERAVKLAVVAGNAAANDEQFAKNYEINVVRPEVFQALVAFKLESEELLRLADLQKELQTPPFGKAANQKLHSFIEKWKNVFDQQTSSDIEFKKAQHRAQQIVQTVKELSKQSIHRARRGFTIVEVRSHYNAMYQPCLTNETVKNILIKLSDPVSAGCLKKHSYPDSEDIYTFEKDMVIPDS